MEFYKEEWIVKLTDPRHELPVVMYFGDRDKAFDYINSLRGNMNDGESVSLEHLRTMVTK